MPQGLFALNEEHPLNRCVVPVVALRDGMQPQPTGSAVMIGHGLALTAKHVIQGFASELGDGKLKRRGDEPHNFSGRIHQHIDESVKSWHIERASSIDGCDISLLQLLPIDGHPLPPDFTFPALRLTPPEVGSMIAGLGFPRSEWIAIESEEIWRYGSAITFGQVETVHLQQRDSAMLAFPCFQTNAFFDGGMSGGAVFNEAHELCGIICSALPATNENGFDEHYSHASLLWPSLVLDFYPPDQIEEDRASASMFHLAVVNMIGVLDIERVRLSADRAQISYVRR